MLTYDEAAKHLNITLAQELIGETEIPVLTGPQCQGDLVILPLAGNAPVGEKITKEIPVVRGENGGNTHALVAHTGEVFWAPNNDGSTDCGVLTVANDAVAYLMHPEHVANGFGPGSYVIRRQWEKRDEMRVVSD